MQAHMPLFISLLAVTVFLFVATLAMMAFSYRARMKKNFDFLTEFPFEGFGIRSANGRHAIMLLILYVIALGLCYSFPLFVKDSIQLVQGRDIVIGIAGGISALLTAILAILGFTNMRRHLLVFIGYTVVYLLTGVVIGFAFYDLRDYYGGVALAFAIASFAIAAMSALVILNPKLSSWGQLKKVGDGEAAIYVRPRPFLLPFSEWLLILFGLAQAVTMMVGMFVIGNLG